MKALRFEDGRLHVADVPVPRADARQALVRVTLAGICNTDLEIARGYADFTGTLGHEFVGIVESAPRGMLAGQRVVGEINAGCGQCALCVAGDPRHCPQRTVLGIHNHDGAFAEFLRLPVDNLLPVLEGVTDEQAVFVEPLAAACGITERVSVTAQTSVAVLGDGKLGLLCAQALAAAGAGEVTLVGKHQHKMQLVARRGIQTMHVDELTAHGTRYDVVVEATGSAVGLEAALRATRPRGVVVLKSTFHGATECQMAQAVVDEISIIGSRCGRFAPAVELLRRGAVDVENLIAAEYKLTDGVQAMADAAEAGVLKVLLRP